MTKISDAKYRELLTMDIKTHTAMHDSFARLPRAQREHAYRKAREMKPQGAIYIDELIAAHQGMLGRA